MDLLDLAKEAGLSPLKVAQTNGGEYICACPKCGDGGKGKKSDRFHVWPNQKAKNCMGHYWCRQCGIKGDSIQFCRNLLGLNYADACSRLKVQMTLSPREWVTDLARPQKTFKKAVIPNNTWQSKASVFVEWCHELIWKYPAVIASLKQRGFNEESIRYWKLGYCPETFWRDRSSWGLSEKPNADGLIAKLWLPQGIVIPTLLDGNVTKIKIRRPDPHKQQEKKFQKYVVVSGSMEVPAVYGDLSKPILIMESELDAMLTFKAIDEICCVIALGGAQKKPDLELHQHLQRASRILLALDFDEGGMKGNLFWRSIYPQLLFWPVPEGKGPGDAMKLGLDLRLWVEAGLKATKL
jgi:DNA primase